MLTNFLRDNKDIFAWKPADMPGVLRELAEHIIDVNEGSKPIKQWLRRFSPKKGSNQEGDYEINGSQIYKRNSSSRLANESHSSTEKNMAEWRMCVDYIDLNKHCPKDPFRLP
jgi:hypothetical protein